MTGGAARHVAEVLPASLPSKEGVLEAVAAGRPRLVCHLIASNFFGGPERQIVAQGESLDPGRWRVVVASFRENRDSVEILYEARRRGLATFMVDTRSPFSPLAVLQLRNELRRRRVDLLVTHGYKADVVGTLASRLTRVPHIIVIRGYTAEDRRVRLYEAVDRWFVKRARHVVCVSHGTRKALLDRGLDPARVMTIHNAVALDDASDRRAGLRKEYELPPAGALILAVGRLSPEKGHKNLIQALSLLAARGSRPHLVVAGAGPERDGLEQLAREIGVDDRVHWAGFRTDVAACMREADLLVNPSSTEGLPNVILEAFAVGTPVVATDVGGVGELVIPGKTGWLVPPRDPEALAGAIGRALARREMSLTMAERARRYVRDEFTFARQAGRLMDLYDRAMGGRI